MKNLFKILAITLTGVFAMSMSGCKPDDESAVKTVKIAVQNGDIVEGEGGEVTFDVTTEHIADGSEGIIKWYTSSDGTAAGIQPAGIVPSVSEVAGNKATVTMTADAEAVTGLYYFTVTIDGVASGVAKLTVGEPAVDYYTVTVESADGGDAVASIAEGTPAASVETTEGTQVTLTATEDDGYEFVKWSVVGEGAIEFLPDAEANPATFVMPAGDVTVKAEFETAANPGEEFGIETVKIRRGTFLMGSPEDEPNRQNGEFDPRANNEVQHEVTLTKDFYIGKYEITNAQYAAFLNDKQVTGTTANGETAAICTWGENDGQIMIYDSRMPAAIAPGFGVIWENGSWSPAEGYEDYPAGWVTWYGAVEYAAYAGGSLPTEAQWEYAARGGVEAKPFGIGDGTKLTSEMANFFGWFPYDVARGGEYEDYEAIALDEPVAVGSYAYPNGYGLYDMHGNVHEWVSDWYDTNYGSDNAGDPATDPVGNNLDGRKIRKGGCFYDMAQYCRSAYREFEFQTMTFAYTGFRIVYVVE